MFSVAQSGIQWQDIELGALSQQFCQLTNISLSRQKHQYVPAFAIASQVDIVHQLGNLFSLPHVPRVNRIYIQGLHWVSSSRYLNHWGIGKVLGKTVYIDGSAGDNHFQVGALGQQAFQIAEQEINIETALVGFIDDQGVILF